MNQTNKECKILLIEDNEIWQSGLYNLLLTKNIKLTDIADNTDTGIDKIKALNPDLVISDISSEQVDGFKIVNEIKKMDYSSKTIFFSSSLCPSKIDKAIKLGVEGLCYRANNLSKLEKAIEITLNGDLYIDGQISQALKTIENKKTTNIINNKSYELRRIINQGDRKLELENTLTIYEEMKESEKLENFRLTELQIKIFALICQDKTNQQIAELLQFNINNIKYHVRQLKNKLEVETRLELVMTGWEMGFLSNLSDLKNPKP
jgi:DNA-binding NarL/FixJ family response regulator